MNRQFVDANIGLVRRFLFAFVLIAVSDPAAAQEASQEVAGLQQRVAALEAELESFRWGGRNMSGKYKAKSYQAGEKS